MWLTFSLSRDIMETPVGDSWLRLWVKQTTVCASNQSPDKDIGIWGSISPAPLWRPLPGYSFFFHSCPGANNWFLGTPYSSYKVAPWPKINNVMLCLYPLCFHLLFFRWSDDLCGSASADSKSPESAVHPQDNTFLSWAHSYAAFHNWSNCWIGGALPSSSVEGFPWWVSPFQGKYFIQLCEYLCQQQSCAMPLFNLMTSINPKMDWCNTLYLNDGHNVTFDFNYSLFWFNKYFAAHEKVNGSRSSDFLPCVYHISD